MQHDLKLQKISSVEDDRRMLYQIPVIEVAVPAKLV
jgi:hypothetical protein